MENVFSRINIDATTVGIRIKVPIQIQVKVKELFKVFLKYKNGIMLRDAYTHCVKKAIELYDIDEKKFNLYQSQVVGENQLQESEHDKNLQVFVPIDTSKKIDNLRQEFLYNKQESFIYLIAIGAKIYETEGMPEGE